MLWLMLLLLMILIPTLAGLAAWWETRNAPAGAGGAELSAAEVPLPERGA